MNLERFKIAQAGTDSGFDVALKELRQGHKVSHWIWYVFPQLRGLGRSPTAQFYAIENAEEARAYVLDPLLGKNLLTAMQVVAGQLARGVSLDELMGGYVDSQKVVSCATLFREVSAGMADAIPAGAIREVANDVLEAAESQGYPPCEQTMKVLSEEDGAKVRLNRMSPDFPEN